MADVAQILLQIDQGDPSAAEQQLSLQMPKDEQILGCRAGLCDFSCPSFLGSSND